MLCAFCQVDPAPPAHTTCTHAGTHTHARTYALDCTRKHKRKHAHLSAARTRTHARTHARTQSLGQGDTVRALARTPANVVIPPGSGGESKAGKPLTSPALTVVQGDVTRYEDVAKVMEGGVDGVVVALGGRTSEVGTTMLTDGTRNIIRAMKEVGQTSKVSVVTSIGAGESYDQAPLLFKVIMWTVLKDAFVDKNKQESLFLDPGAPGNDLDYAIVRPGGLTKGAPTGQINVLPSTEQVPLWVRAQWACDALAFMLRGRSEQACATWLDCAALALHPSIPSLPYTSIHPSARLLARVHSTLCHVHRCDANSNPFVFFFSSSLPAGGINHAS
jgi:hypothetical protein